MKYQAVLFDLDGTLLPMDEATFVKCFYSLLVPYVTPEGKTYREIGEMLMQSLEHVIRNDGSMTNEQAFIGFYEDYGRRNNCDVRIDSIEEFYATVFDQQVRTSCGYDPVAAQVIEYLKRDGTPAVLATNPFFPRVGTRARLGWAGLDPKDFVYITTYENSHYCKPNLMYYKEVFENTGYDPKQCLMVGNNVAEDMIAERLGCDAYLITRNLINPAGVDIAQYKHGDLADLLAYMQSVK